MKILFSSLLKMASFRNRKLSFMPAAEDGDLSSPSPPPEGQEDIRKIVETIKGVGSTVSKRFYEKNTTIDLLNQA